MILTLLYVLHNTDLTRKTSSIAECALSNVKTDTLHLVVALTLIYVSRPRILRYRYLSDEKFWQTFRTRQIMKVPKEVKSEIA